MLATLAIRRGPALDPASPRATAAVVRHAVADEPRSRDFTRGVDPSVATGLLLTLGVAIVVVGDLRGRHSVLDGPSQRRTRAARPRAPRHGAGIHATDLSTSVLRAITQFGSTLGRHHRRGRRRAGRVPAHADARASLLPRPRDRWAEPDREPGEGARRSGPPRHPPARGLLGASFPSGHSAAAAATYAACALLIGRSRSPSDAGDPERRGGGDRGCGRELARAARRALVHGCPRGPRARLGGVRPGRDRVRWTSVAVRCTGGGGRTRRRARRHPAPD